MRPGSLTLDHREAPQASWLRRPRLVPESIDDDGCGDRFSQRYDQEVIGRRRVLFLCVRNSARSQMAEGILRAVAPDRFEAFSAGLEAGTVRPEAVTVMREIGVDISAQRSKAVDEFAGRPFDVVVTTCDEAMEACPLFPGAKSMLHWSFSDPAAVRGDEATRLAAFREVRDGLKERVEQLARSS